MTSMHFDPTSNARFYSVCALSALMLSVSMPALPQARQPAPPREEPTITLNYKDADITQIIQAVGEVTGKNFIIDPRVNAKVNMVSSTPMSPQAFYETFLSVLQVYGYVAVPAGRVIKIIPRDDERQYPGFDLQENVSSSSDELVTQVVNVKNLNAQTLVPMLRPFVATQGQLVAYPAGNDLI